MVAAFTVTALSAVGFDRLTVNCCVLLAPWAPSAAAAALLTEIVGVASSSVIVAVADAVPAVTFTRFVRPTLNVSSFSSVVSPFTKTVTVSWMSPGTNASACATTAV